MYDLGAIEQSIARQALRSGNKLPDRIKNAPELRLGLEFYMVAFFELDTERNHSFGPTPIPWSSIKDYAFYHELDEEQSEELFFLIRELDSENLKRIGKKQSKK